MVLILILTFLLAQAGVAGAVSLAAWFGSHVLVTIVLVLLFA